LGRKLSQDGTRHACDGAQLCVGPVDIGCPLCDIAAAVVGGGGARASAGTRNDPLIFGFWLYGPVTSAFLQAPPRGGRPAAPRGFVLPIRLHPPTRLAAADGLACRPLNYQECGLDYE
jgi:hypothetical protein